MCASYCGSPSRGSSTRSRSWCWRGWCPASRSAASKSAVILAAAIAILHATLRPVLVWVALPLIVLTGGLLSLVISAVFVLLAAYVSEGVTLTNFWAALVVVLGLGLVNAVAGVVLPFDDDRSYFSGVTRRTGRRYESEGFRLHPRAGHVRDRRSGRPDPPAGDRRRGRPDDGALDRRGLARPDPMGVRSLVADRCQPGGHPPWRQHEHARLSVVREGDRAHGRVQPPERRGRERARASRPVVGCWPAAAPRSATCSRVGPRRAWPR